MTRRNRPSCQPLFGPERELLSAMQEKNPMRAGKCSRGQSLIETALLMPLMLGIILNAVNLGYFFFVTVNLTGATRTAAEFSMIGPNSPGTTAYAPACNKAATCPGAGPNVTDLIYQHLTGAVGNASSATVQVCSVSLGTSGSGSSTKSQCVVCTSSASSSCTSTTLSGSGPDADPEAPTYLLNRVDVKYQFKPLIPGTVFNLVLLNTAFSGGQYTFYRHIEMRAM